MAAQPVVQPAGTHLAQLNVARTADALNSARMADFVANLDRVNAAAERSPGFVWRFQDDGGAAIDTQATPDPRLLINMSVWETPEALEHYVWNTIHKRIYARKAEFVEPHQKAHFVMWFVPAGHVPSVAEAFARLETLREKGPSAEAFGWESLPNVTLWRSQRCG